MNRHGFRDINDFARHTSWLHGFFADWAAYGILLFAALLLAGWWAARRDDSPRRMAALLWTPVAALLAVAINQPIVHAVNERRPFVAMPHVLTLVHHAADAGFPSDHATASGALAVGLLVASRRLGWLAAIVAVVIAFSRVYVGVHYPGDVLAGLLLGAVVALAGMIPALWLGERAVLALRRGPLSVLVAVRRQEARHAASPHSEDADSQLGRVS